MTPDRDVHVESFSGMSEDGPVSFKVKREDFKYWSRAGLFIVFQITPMMRSSKS